MAKKRYYLAYGSNLNVDQMRDRCPDAVPVGTAVIKDYRLLFKGSKSGSYLTIEKCKGASVPVGVWLVGKDDERALDRYEGYPLFYYKKRMAIDVADFKDGKIWNVEAFVYIMHEERKLGVPSMHYLRILEQAYKEFGFDGEILGDAYDYSQPESLSAEDLSCLW